MENYIEMAMRTAVKLGRQGDFVHAALGLVSEVQELMDAWDDDLSVHEELGDILWFVALACDVIACDPFRLRQEPHDAWLSESAAAEEIQAYANLIASRAKRWHAYGREPDELEQGVEAGHLIRLIDLVEVIAKRRGMTLAEVQEANIRKLRARFPDKFDQERALDRDLAAERAALEGQA